MKVVDIVRPTKVWAPPMTYLTFSYMIIHVPAISSHHKPSETIKIIKKYCKHSQTITVIHSIPIYLNTTQYIAIYPTQGTKKTEHTALSSSAGQFPGTAGTAGAAWVAMGCWLLLAKHTWCLVNLDHPKIIKNMQKHCDSMIFHAFSGIVKIIQM